MSYRTSLSGNRSETNVWILFTIFSQISLSNPNGANSFGPAYASHPSNGSVVYFTKPCFAALNTSPSIYMQFLY